MEHIWKSFKEILIEPYNFFSKKLYLKRAIEYVLVLYLITFIFSTLFKLITSTIPLNQALMTVLSFFLGLIIVVLLILISALIFHLFLLLFRVEKNDYWAVASIFAYCLTPLIIANLFFFLQYFYYLIAFFIVWNVILLMTGISHYYNISKIKSFFVVIFSYLVILLITGFIAGLVVK